MPSCGLGSSSSGTIQRSWTFVVFLQEYSRYAISNPLDRNESDVNGHPAHAHAGTCLTLGRRDPLAGFAERFARPETGSLHFDANSMGAMPADVPDRIRHLLTACWRDQSRRAWTSEGWVEKPRELGADIAHMVGANPGDVVVCDNTPSISSRSSVSPGGFAAAATSS